MTRRPTGPAALDEREAPSSEFGQTVPAPPDPALRALRNEGDRLLAILREFGARCAEETVGEPRPPTQDAPPRPADNSPLATMAGLLGLSPFEQDVLFLCVGMELFGEFPAACAEAAGDPARDYPTFSLALAALSGAHWDALSPEGPLRAWRLIEVGPGPDLIRSRLKADERIVHELVGVSCLDARLRASAAVEETEATLTETQWRAAALAASAWSARDVGRGGPVLQLHGPDAHARLAAAREACGLLGMRVLRIDAARALAPASDPDETLLLWSREAILRRAALVVEFDGLDPAQEAAAEGWASRCPTPLVMSSREPRRAGRASLLFEIPAATPAERVALWDGAIRVASSGWEAQVDPDLIAATAGQFRLDPSALRDAADEATLAAPDHPEGISGALWDACRVRARPRLGDLATRVEAGAGWDDLIVNGETRLRLREVEDHVRQRARVLDGWGFASRGGRGLGLAALFSGPSGTGKTLAAEVLANALRLDLYRVDLSQVVSKYIGETEKHLAQVFDAAEAGGAILLFDEADALFGKRSEVKGSHDRFANIEVGYLLQRIEAYRGLAILTTNLKDDLDPSFLRRLRFVVHFEPPDALLRAAIWRRAIPPGAPTEGIDPEKLAGLNLSGAHIRNIALYAAHLAAAERSPLRMAHLHRAAIVETSKLGRTWVGRDIDDWL